MKTSRIVLGAPVLISLGGLLCNQWQLQRAINKLKAAAPPGAEVSDETTQRLQTEARWNQAKLQLEVSEQKLTEANARLAQVENRLRALENSSRTSLPNSNNLAPTDGRLIEPQLEPPTTKRSWGPEQATGEPDTFQAGDISTAWAPLEQDAGEEWLRLDYERAVDIAEVRVRETHNPGAISKVTAFMANGAEATLWEGVEPKTAAPVEMSFQVPDSVSAKSVKVYLDTKRVPGWNGIDAVELIGRDGTHQWAKQASASSTYAEQGVASRNRRLQEF